MTTVDALVITVLGMSVVFAGLLLTAGLIVLFGIIGRRGGTTEEGRASEPAPAAAGGVLPVPEDAAVVAVITTVLEVERRLHRAEVGGRLTISRNG